MENLDIVLHTEKLYKKWVADEQQHKKRFVGDDCSRDDDDDDHDDYNGKECESLRITENLHVKQI